MLLDIAWRLKKLFEDIAEEGNAPDTPDADEAGMIDAVGEQAEPLTSFGYVRDMLPTLRMLTPPQPGAAMTADEVAAWDMLCQHGFSRIELEKSGELEAYRSLGISPETEARWLGSFMEGLIDRAEAHPEGLDQAMWLAAEYGDEMGMSRALEVLDDAVTEEALRDGAILGSCLNAALAVEAGDFAPAFKAEAKARALETGHRAEAAVRAWLPDSRWLGAAEDLHRLSK